MTLLPKITLILLFTCFGSNAFAQQIKTNEVNGFTQERTIETSVISLKTSYTNGIGISFSMVGAHYLVNLVGYGNGIGPIRKNDFLYLLMGDGLILTTTSIGDQPENDGGLTRVYQHHYLLRYKDLNDLAKKPAALIRATTQGGNIDMPLSKRSANEIKKLSVVFLKEVMKYAPAKILP